MFIVYYLMICRSLTYAQRSAALLERAGLSAYVQRIPKPIAREGCGYAVRVPERHLTQGLILLRREGLAPRQIYIARQDGNYEEVAL